MIFFHDYLSQEDNHEKRSFTVPLGMADDGVKLRNLDMFWLRCIQHYEARFYT